MEKIKDKKLYDIQKTNSNIAELNYVIMRSNKIVV